MRHPDALRNLWNRAPLPSLDVAKWFALSTGAVGVAAVVVMGIAENPFNGDGNGRDTQAYVASLSPYNRFQHDYAGQDPSGDDCLSPTGYDLNDPGHNKVVPVGKSNVIGDIITITPGDSGDPNEPNKYAEPIELKMDSGPDRGARPLQPANNETAEILALHGCMTQTY